MTATVAGTVVILGECTPCAAHDHGHSSEPCELYDTHLGQIWACQLGNGPTISSADFPAVGASMTWERHGVRVVVTRAEFTWNVQVIGTTLRYNRGWGSEAQARADARRCATDLATTH